MRGFLVALLFVTIAGTSAAESLPGTWTCTPKIVDGDRAMSVDSTTVYRTNGRFSSDLVFTEISDAGTFEAFAVYRGRYVLQNKTLDTVPTSARVKILRLNGQIVENRDISSDIRERLLLNSAPLNVIELTGSTLVLTLDGKTETCRRAS